MRVNPRVRRSIGWVWLTLVALLGLPQSVRADSAPKWTDAQLVSFSDVVLRGRVTDVVVARDERVGTPYTYVSLDVAEVLKGAISGSQVTLKQLGGRLGSSELRIAGQPTFAIGEDVLVFLEMRPRDRTLTTTALWQGKFTIVSGAGGDMAMRLDPGGLARGVFNGQTRSLAPWLAQLHDQASEALASSAGAPETAPLERATAAVRDASGNATSANWRDTTVRVDAAAPGQAGMADGGEQQLRRAADFWTAAGVATLETGGLQPAGCFTARDPDGRITVGVDTCQELSLRGGTIALSGGWIAYDTDTNGAAGSQLVGGGVITNPGETAVRLLARSSCFEKVMTHELGHALGLSDAPDGGGVMAPTIDCDMGLGAASSTAAAANHTARPMFVPLRASAAGGAAKAGGVYDTIACAVGCRISAAVAISAPNAPTNVASSLSGATLTLTWTAPLNDTTHAAPTAYTVEIGSGAGLTNIVNVSTGGTATIYTTTVATNTALFVRVRATNASGASDPSAEIVVVVGNPAAPSAPTNLASTLVGSTLTLTWTAPQIGSPPTAYTVEAGSVSGATDVANFSTGSTATTFSATVAGNATFYIRVRATNASGTSAASGEIAVVIGGPAQAPGIPGGLTASAAGSSVTLAWTAPANGGAVTSYVIEAGSGSGGTNLANFSTGSTATVFSAAGVSAGTYFVRVRAANAAGASATSNEVVLVVGGGCADPSAPSNLMASVSGSNVTLVWGAGAGATSYQLQAGSGPGLSNLFDQNLVSPATAVTATNVGVGTYFVRVRSINACSVSAASNETLIIIR